MLQWILIAVALIAAYCFGFVKGSRSRLKDLEEEWNERDREREEYERELEEKDEELYNQTIEELETMSFSILRNEPVSHVH